MAEGHISHLERWITVNQSAPLQKSFLNWDSKDIKRKLVWGGGGAWRTGMTGVICLLGLRALVTNVKSHSYNYVLQFNNETIVFCRL